MIFKIFGKSSEIFGSGRKTSENGSKVIFRCFNDFLKFSENFRKSSEVFGNGSKVIFRCFHDILKFSENFRKIFGSVRKSGDIFTMKIWKISYSGPGCTLIWIL